MRKTAVILAIVVWCSAGVAHAGGKSRKQKQIDRALWTAQYHLVHEHDYAAATREYQKVLKLDPRHAGAGLMLAEIHISQRKHKQAVAVLEKLIKRSGKDGSVWRALGRAKTAAGDGAGAVAAYNKAIAIDPRDIEAQWLVFEHFDGRYRGGDKSVKAELLTAARGFVGHTAYPQGPQFKRVERVIVELSGDPLELTIYDAKQAYDDAFAETNWGSINQHMARAREGFETCVDKQPDNEQCHYRLGLVYGSVKASQHYDAKKAHKHLEKAASLPEAHVQIARMHRIADSLPAAKKALKKAIALSPTHQRAHLELGIVYKLDGRDQDAQKSFAKAVQLDNWSAAAASALDELAKINPNHSLVKARLAYGSLAGDVFSTNRFTAAIDLIEEAYGGVDAAAKEQKVLEEMLGRIVDNADVDSEFSMRVAVLNTPIVNAMALPNGNIYFTRGLLDFARKEWPNRKLDANNDVLGHIMAHEVAHVIRRHTLQSALFQEAVKDAQRPLDGAVITHVTRLHEIEADRIGIVLGFLAGYHPRGGIEFMEKSGIAQEIPPELDHPTYEERVQYLEEYWSNDVKFAFQAFSFGVTAMTKAGKLESTDAAKAAQEYKRALVQFETFRNTLKATKRVLNNMGIVNAKLGVLAMAKQGTPLHRWQTRFSIERESAMAYVSVVREAEAAPPKTRGMSRDRKGRGHKPTVPREIKRAIALFEEALQKDPSYPRAKLNLAATYLAIEDYTKADRTLAGLKKGARGIAWGDVLILRGISRAERRDHGDARKNFEAAAKLRGSAQAATYNLARALEVSGDKPTARQTYEAYAAKWPQGPWAKAAKGRIKALR